MQDLARRQCEKNVKENLARIGACGCEGQANEGHPRKSLFGGYRIKAADARGVKEREAARTSTMVLCIKRLSTSRHYY